VLTDRLTEALEDAVSTQPFVPALEPVFRRARRLRVRRRVGRVVAAGAAVAVVAVGAHSVLGTTQSSRQLPATHSPSPTSGTLIGPDTDSTIELRPQTEPFRPLPITVGWVPFPASSHSIVGSTLTPTASAGRWTKGDIGLRVTVTDYFNDRTEGPDPEFRSLKINGTSVVGSIDGRNRPVRAWMAWEHRPHEWIEIYLGTRYPQTKTLAPIGITSRAAAVRLLKRIALSIRDVQDPTTIPFSLTLYPRGAEPVCWDEGLMELATQETLYMVNDAPDPCASSNGVVVAVLNPLAHEDPFSPVTQGTNERLSDGRTAIVETTASVRRLQIGTLRINVPRIWPMRTLLQFAAGVRYTGDATGRTAS